MNKMRHSYTLAILLPTLAAAAASPNAQSAGLPALPALKYPPTQRDSTVDTYFGTQVPAPYQWMENLDSPAVQQWVEAENALTFSYLDKVPVRSWIKDRLTTLWNYARESTPELVADGRIFFSKNSGLQNQSVVYVQDSPTAAPRELLDPNTLSPDGSVALLGYEPSPRGVLSRLQPLARRLGLAHHPRARRRDAARTCPTPSAG